MDFDGKTVTFRARNNKKPGTYRPVQLSALEFMRRFLLHVLPHGFIRIRHYGLLAPRNVHTKLAIAKRLLTASPAHIDGQPPEKPQSPAEDLLLDWTKLLFKVTGVDLTVCPKCGGNMLRTALTDNLRLATLTFYAVAGMDSS